MVDIPTGETGTSVPRRAAEEHVQEADHAIILFHSTVEQTARPWDPVWKLGLVMKVLVQVRTIMLNSLNYVPYTVIFASCHLWLLQQIDVNQS